MNFNKETHKYLTSLGFKYREAIGEYNIYYDLLGVTTIQLDPAVRIVNIEQLCTKIIEQSFESGKRQGKAGAISKITRKLNDIVYE
jgi:hypothetical protein